MCLKADVKLGCGCTIINHVLVCRYQINNKDHGMPEGPCMTEGKGGEGVMTQLSEMLVYDLERCSAFHGGRRDDVPQTIEQHHLYRKGTGSSFKRRMFTAVAAAGKPFKTGGMKTVDGEDMD
ncbi:hypothetical protein BP6252_13520 [Coleophoma cylindrospora]|uniref:Uncharacterized protein n=1 Tax=Coleophoma cylindrospora TaxID=1849047 RepID=A0A3D8Q8H7_9HELO|nr:hypothetical protein BP6252_13520 [Coleophoma cylindrospora]